MQWLGRGFGRLSIELGAKGRDKKMMAFAVLCKLTRDVLDHVFELSLDTNAAWRPTKDHRDSVFLSEASAALLRHSLITKLYLSLSPPALFTRQESRLHGIGVIVINLPFEFLGRSVICQQLFKIVLRLAKSTQVCLILCSLPSNIGTDFRKLTESLIR